MNRKNGQIWAILKENGCVDGEPPERKAPGSPWYVKALLAFSGWLAALFLLGFLGIGFEFILKNGLAASIVGLMLIGGAFALIRNDANDFVDHLGLALSMAGQALAVYGIYEITGHHETTVWLLLALLQCALAVVMPNQVHRILSSLVAAIAFSMALSRMGFSYVTSALVMLGAAMCWLHEFRFPRHISHIRAIGYGLVLALMALECTTLVGHRVLGKPFWHSHSGSWAHPWLGHILVGAVSVYLVLALLKRYGQPVHGRLSILCLSATLLLCAVSFNVQGLMAGVFIMCLGFYAAGSTLLGLGIVSLIVYISSYYYMLDATLLEKSLSLFVAGLFLLCVRGLTGRIVPMQNEVHHG